ncbi:hypothetical protein [Acanthopleuribacter pedis]|uniref:Uncharacterized protein n=1 Tax=Acanthopleuribacter pedis TaxID=442870 RepID=A0A8J7QEW4_9BACT|nr:hypothetical protein [Acanthopleuribacter pedis]
MTLIPLTPSQKYSNPQKNKKNLRKLVPSPLIFFSDQVSISPEGISKALGKGFLAVTELDSAEKPQSLTPDNSNRLNMVLSDMGYPPNTPSISSGGTGGAPDVPPIKDKPGGVG